MKVASLVHNHLTHDSRVEKQALSLGNAGYDLNVFGLWKKGLLEEETKQGFKIKRIKICTSFLKGSIHRMVTSRAGNVIGGGDWSLNRIIPDCVRSKAINKKVKIRI